MLMAWCERGMAGYDALLYIQQCVGIDNSLIDPFCQALVVSCCMKQIWPLGSMAVLQIKNCTGACARSNCLHQSGVVLEG